MNYKTTIVTMFFNMKKLKDASNQTRPIDFYIKNGTEILKLDYPMYIFCDEDTKDFIMEIRNQYVKDKTVLVVKNLVEYDYYKQNYDIIKENRDKSNGYKDPNNRNTVSYFLMGMFKPYALKYVKEENKFNTDYFAWIDLGCNHICRNIQDNVSNMLNNPNPKVSCCYIHYRSHDEIQDMRQYMEFGGKCGIASTAYTVQKEYVNRYYNSMFSIFYEMLYKGYGHTDETVMTYCYDRYPNIFDIYYGDYYSIFSNYKYITDDYYSVKNFYIEECKKKERDDLVKLCAIKLIKSINENKLKLNKEEQDYIRSLI